MTAPPDLPQYVAKLTRVREVSILGSAKLQFWKDQLKTATIVPAEFEGKARILITASDATFMGMRLQEFSVCVLVTSPNPEIWLDSAFLIHAYNSRRFFAWFERTMYSTPYYHGQIAVSASTQPEVELRVGGERAFCVTMQGAASGTSREPSRSGEERWSGPIFLPALRRSGVNGGKVFFAEISGHTRRYPFVTSEDKLEVRPSAPTDIFQSLIDSSFTPEEWLVRENAVHAKTFTYSTSQALRRFGATKRLP